MRLSGKSAIVTGAASGMGKAIAEWFAREGAMVVVSDLNVNHAATVVKQIEESGGKAIAVQANVAVEDDVRRLFEFATSAFGTVDILVNNAGIMDNFVPAAELTDDLWEKVFAVNTTGTMRTTRKALEIFVPKKAGVIINIASAGGLFGSRAGAAYTASKHAVVGFTKNVGYQYASLGIRCNAIAPGGVNTNISATMTAPSPFGAERAMAGMAINPRVGEPEEIAKVALFLASDESSFVNGTTVTADAGWTAY
ncbi:SDR family oxidoreductase [Paenibacillus glycanilyticus]|uniref:SDR family oxidoreductase n=1 Tax=Paenibacillus glycanilyticus TaxID=126569 RepID=UPI0019109D9A|nr:SDR family oxidoreductase [Paenibacillus glycanilyticus]